MKDFKEFEDGIADGIEKGLTIDPVGDYTFNIDNAVDGVIDYLTHIGMLTIDEDSPN